MVLLTDSHYRNVELNKMTGKPQQTIGVEICGDIKLNLLSRGYKASLVCPPSTLTNTPIDINDFDVLLGTNLGKHEYDVEIGKKYVNRLFTIQYAEQEKEQRQA